MEKLKTINLKRNIVKKAYFIVERFVENLLKR